MSDITDKQTTRPVILVVVGTRPEVIKCQNMITGLSRRADIQLITATTGQHRDITPPILAELPLKTTTAAEIESDVGGLAQRLARSLERLTELISRHDISTVVAQGDTLSAYTAALAAFLTPGTRLLHIEAGVRSTRTSEPYPEEGFRRMITNMTDNHICFEQQAVANLIREGVPYNRIQLTHHPAETYLPKVFAKRKLIPTRDMVLITFHRRERRADRLAKLTNILNLLRQARPATTIKVVKHPKVDLRPMAEMVEGLIQLDPMSHVAFLNELAQAGCLVTDSAGAVEESTRMLVPTLSFRQAVENRSLGPGPILHTEQVDVASRFIVHHLERRMPQRDFAGIQDEPTRERSRLEDCVLRAAKVQR